MSSLDWTAFNRLPGSKSQNFENLCRQLIRSHFEACGKFRALKNQPGVEFHLELSQNCPRLGGPPRWYGWQCKFHELTTGGDLRATSRKDIESSLEKTEKYLSGLTDWVLWTPFTLSKKDQKWFESLQNKFKLRQWAEEEIEYYLSGPGLHLRSSYFGELIATPEELDLRHREAIQPIRERWLEPVHQSVNAERTIRRMLGEPGSWDHLLDVGKRLKKVVDAVADIEGVMPIELEKMITPFVSACTAFAKTLLSFHETLADGDIDIIQQELVELKTTIDTQVRTTPRRLRACNLPIALDATNALNDMRIAEELLDEIKEFLGEGLVVLLAPSGGGKTQLAAQLTAPQNDRSAGILLHGRDLQRGQKLDDLAGHFWIYGNPVTSMERLLAALDAAGKRGRCRLPLIIDGLNEAENPKDWKAPLAVLRETLKRYPNVLVVCTLRTGDHRQDDQMAVPQSQTTIREAFAAMALPDGVRRIECEGFGVDVREAIGKYFKHFKINSGDAEIPEEFLQHPLTLRIFCQVTNLKQESEIKIDYFPSSLAPLFEKYVANACERISQMTNLRPSYNAAEIQSAIYKFGKELWEAKKREVDEANYREALRDTSHSWDSCIVNLLVQEGIVFRNPGVEPGSYVITPVYDALGGHIVADFLLKRHTNDRKLKWLEEPEVMASFHGDESHQLAFDIFKSLVALFPRRMNGRNFWKEAPGPFRNTALLFTTELEVEHLDGDTVAGLMALLKDYPAESPRLFPQLMETRGSDNHPLNCEFLDSVLRSMSVAERDLNWTEWVRATRHERFDDILTIEHKWKADLAKRTPSDKLKAKWVMWLLTSTDHELRDVATRALYWFGRAAPEVLFEESLSALEINDPYVPERMLAASYGVAMARHVDLGVDQTFVKRTLQKYSRRLYELLFSQRAQFGTTHLLLREYAARTIELTALHNPELFSCGETERCKPPFTDGGLRDWGESETAKEVHHGLDSPFRMDFENYTLSRLVPGRWNYDYGHEGYRKIRSQILWRIEQLGWTSERFKTVDSSIENTRYWPRTGSDAKKTDRYGKKYSWIANFEMSGLLHDQGILTNRRERTSSVDIDPSFPEPVAKGHIIKANFLGDPKMDMKEWIANGPLPNIAPYFRLGEVQQMKGPWIALDGLAVQEDVTCGRNSFCFIRSFLVANKNADSFLDHLSHQYLGGRWLPEKPEVIYTFAGEIPWCDTFSKNGQSEFSFETVKVQRSQRELYLNGAKLRWAQVDLTRRNVSDDVSGETEDQQHISDEDLKRIEVREVPVEVEEVRNEDAKFNALIPVCDFGWEGYQTAASDAGHATTLAKEISSDLGLIGRPQTFDLFTKDGVRATCNVSDQSNDFNNHQAMLFIRENLLKMYLEKNYLALFLVMWGERGYSSDQIHKLFLGPNRPKQTHDVFSFVERYG